VTQQNSTPHGPFAPSERHQDYLFEIRKQAGYAHDPQQTAAALSEIAYRLDLGAISNVQLNTADRLALDDQLSGLELHAFRHLPNDFTRSDIIWGFEVMRAQVERWSLEPADRLDGDQRMNLIEIARIWRNRLHNAALAVTVLRRVGASERRSATVAELMERAATAGPAASQSH
jgi:hypothetical protein